MSTLTTWRSYDDRQPSWSPDGRRIAFISNREGKWQIYSMDAHGMDVKRITKTPTRDAFPAWSPDGKRIAYCALRFGTWSICVVEVGEEHSPAILTNNPAREESPTWSPDGQKIAYHSDREGNYDIWVCEANGAKQTRLTSGHSTDLRPAWSPDGKKIAFHSNREGPDQRVRPGRQAIWVMDADGGNLLQLTRGPGNETSPAWSPDGSKVAFIAEEDGKDALCVVDADGSNRRSIVSLGTECDRPCWSPDGKVLAFDSNPSGVFRIQTVALDGTQQLELLAEEPQRAPIAVAPASARQRPPGASTTARPAAVSTPRPDARLLATRSAATSRRGLFWGLVRLVVVLGVLAGIYYGVTYFQGRYTKPVLVDEPTVTQELSDVSVTYTIRNEGRAGLIKAKVVLILDDGERLEPLSPLGAHSFRARQEKTFTENFVIRGDRQVKDTEVELSPKPR